MSKILADLIAKIIVGGRTILVRLPRSKRNDIKSKIFIGLGVFILICAFGYLSDKDKAQQASKTIESHETAKVEPVEKAKPKPTAKKSKPKPKAEPVKTSREKTGELVDKINSIHTDAMMAYSYEYDFELKDNRDTLDKLAKELHGLDLNTIDPDDLADPKKADELNQRIKTMVDHLIIFTEKGRDSLSKMIDGNATDEDEHQIDFHDDGIGIEDLVKLNWLTLDENWKEGTK